MSKISSSLCKLELVLFVKHNKERLEQEFVPPEDMTPAMYIKNWKRRGKYTDKDGITEREFDCTPYEDQLRGYTYDDGEKIIRSIVQGE